MLIEIKIPHTGDLKEALEEAEKVLKDEIFFAEFTDELVRLTDQPEEEDKDVEN